MTIDRNKVADSYVCWGYKVSVNNRFEIVKIERVFDNPTEIVGELYVQGADADLLDRVFAILEWSKKSMLEALDRAFSVDYPHA